MGSFTKKWRCRYAVITAIVVAVCLFIVGVIFFVHHYNKRIPVYTYKINEIYPHDKSAFTQGLIYRNDYFYESTGIFGQSEIRKVEPESGKVLDYNSLPDHLFGEGITVLNNKLYQLTWKSGVVIVYDINNLKPVETFHIPGEGWGLTNDGEHFIQSDGSDRLNFLDPDTLNRDSYINVSDEKGAVKNLNELQYINGLVFANILETYKIAAIDPFDGKVQFWIDCTGIIESSDYPGIDVMNGIAFDKEQERLFITGKFWPYMFDISVVDRHDMTIIPF